MDGATGGVMHSFVHRPSLRFQRLQSADDEARRHQPVGPRRLEIDRAWVDIFHRHLLSRCFSSSMWPMGRGRRPAPRHVYRRFVLGGWLLYFRGRRLRPQYLADLYRLRLFRRHWPRPWLYLAGLNPDQMVSRPARHVHRHGHHGLRRRRFHRFAAIGLADAEIFHADARGRRRNFHRLGRYLSHLHVGRRGDRPHSGSGLEARRLHAAGVGAKVDHQERRISSTTRSRRRSSG